MGTCMGMDRDRVYYFSSWIVCNFRVFVCNASARDTAQWLWMPSHIGTKGSESVKRLVEVGRPRLPLSFGKIASSPTEGERRQHNTCCRVLEGQAEIKLRDL